MKVAHDRTMILPRVTQHLAACNLIGLCAKSNSLRYIFIGYTLLSLGHAQVNAYEITAGT